MRISCRRMLAEYAPFLSFLPSLSCGEIGLTRAHSCKVRQPGRSMTIDHRIGLLLFPKVTQLDLAGPYEVFSRTPRAAVHLLWKDTQPSRSEWGLELRPDTRFEECPALDVLCVPGGPGAFDLLGDELVVAAIRAIARRSRFVTSVCTGAFLL